MAGFAERDTVFRYVAAARHLVPIRNMVGI